MSSLGQEEEEERLWERDCEQSLFFARKEHKKLSRHEVRSTRVNHARKGQSHSNIVFTLSSPRIFKEKRYYSQSSD